MYDWQARLLGEFVAHGEPEFPTALADVPGRDIGILTEKPNQLTLRDDQINDALATLGTLVVNPNQRSLNGTFSRSLSVLGLVCAITTFLGLCAARLLSQTRLRPVADLTV